MAANRFDTSQQQQYVSSYVPLPFEAISNLGAKMTKDHELKQAEADALAEAINKIKVTNEVISEGAGDDLGIKSRKIGYGDFKNEVINKYTQANKQLTDDYYAGKLNPNEFNQKVNQLKSQFSSDYQKLKFAEANSVAIEEANKKYRENKEAGMSPYLLNQMAEEGRRLLDNPYGNEYKGAPIGEALDLAKAVNTYSSDYQDQIGKSGARRDEYGNIIYSSISGVTRDRIIDNVARTFDNDAKLVSDYREQTKRQLLDQGVNLNSKEGQELFGKIMNNHKSNFIQAVVDKAEKSKLDRQIKKDWQFARSLDKEDEEKSKEIITTNEQGAPEAINIQNAINSFGLQDVMNDKGEVVTSPLGVTGNVTKGGIVTNKKPSKTEDQLALENMTKLVKLSNNLGLGKPFIVNENGEKVYTNDYRKQIYDYVVNVAKRRSTTSNLQQSTIQGMNKSMLGPNSNIHNMEFYLQGDESSNAKVTSEEIQNIPKNASYTGVDFFGPNQAGWKLAVSSKDDGIVDKAYLAVPRDKGFEEDTRAVHKVSRGVLEFAKTGKINDKYIDSDVEKQLQSKLDKDYAKLGWGKAPKLVATSMEKNRYGDLVMMGTYLDNSTGTPDFKAVVYTIKKDGTPEFKETSLDAIQADKVSELQVKGSLKQYNTKLSETIKPSDVAESEEDSDQ